MCCEIEKQNEIYIPQCKEKQENELNPELRFLKCINGASEAKYAHDTSFMHIMVILHLTTGHIRMVTAQLASSQGVALRYKASYCY